MRRSRFRTIVGLNVVLTLLLPACGRVHGPTPSPAGPGPSVNATEYVAFSLRVAQERLSQGKGGTSDPELFNLGGITAVRGLVYDRERGDPIIVGERDSHRPPLTLDDLVVALRARFIHGQWPMVSIDPTPDTPKTNRQVVRFEGGIADTTFGQTLFEADYLLKELGLGLVPASVPGFRSFWDLWKEWGDRQAASSWVGSRFWFYPVLPTVAVREDVASCTGLSVAVFTEAEIVDTDGRVITAPAPQQHDPAHRFARWVTEHFAPLSRAHPVLGRLEGLLELVALARAIEVLEERPDITFWLRTYRVRSVRTPAEVLVLRRVDDSAVALGTGAYPQLLPRGLFGGIELMALATRLQAVRRDVGSKTLYRAGGGCFVDRLSLLSFPARQVAT